MKGFAKTLYSIGRYKAMRWLPDYLRRRRRSSRSSGKTHILFSLVDHFEPSRRRGEEGIRDVQHWCDAYASIACKYVDADGLHPQHTWFYRYDYPEYRCLDILSKATFEGFGEIEFHLHHGNSTDEWYDKTIADGKAWFQSAGAMIEQGEQPSGRFAYIAGNWALDNGQMRDDFSGVNNEIGILSKHGCYADFTFPAFGEESQPPTVNNIYMARASSEARSYWRGDELVAGKPPQGDLMIVQGPVGIDFRRGYMEYASFEGFTPYFRRRIDYWLDANVHVAGRPDWVFVKLHTHGMQAKDTVVGPQFDALLSDLSALDPEHYEIHFVTARETYNLAMAAAAGQSGEPGKFRDYAVAKPFNRDVYVSVPYRPQKFSDNEISIVLPEFKPGYAEFRRGPIKRLEFDANTYELNMCWDGDRVTRLVTNADGRLNTVLRHGCSGLSAPAAEGDATGSQQKRGEYN